MNSGDSEPPAGVYRRYLKSGGLAFQRCAGCGAAVFYPRVDDGCVQAGGRPL